MTRRPSETERARYEAVAARLEAFATRPIDNTPPLSSRRFRALLARRGDPDRETAMIVVAGTCGKGSTSIMLASILGAAGFRVGLFTGPHLVRYSERIAVDGREIDLVEWADRVDQALDIAEVVAAEAGDDPCARPSLLEVLALSATEYFRDADVEVAVMEAGVGGRRDYTGALEARLCVMTPIDLDHTHLLGATIEEIAREKSGIIRAGVPLVSTADHARARRVLVQRCQEVGAPLELVGRDFRAEDVITTSRGTWFRYRDGRVGAAGWDLRAPLPGAHQAVNAAGAVAAARRFMEGELREWGADLEVVVRRGLERASFPGRLEYLESWEGRPDILLDGAHQPAGARALREALDELFPGREVHLVLGILSDKDREGIVQALVPRAARVVVTAPPWASRAGDLASLEERVRVYAAPGVEVASFTDHAEALRDACEGAAAECEPERVVEARRNGETSDPARWGEAGGPDWRGDDDEAAWEEPLPPLVCVTGSLYLVGAVRHLLIEERTSGT